MDLRPEALADWLEEDSLPDELDAGEDPHEGDDEPDHEPDDEIPGEAKLNGEARALCRALLAQILHDTWADIDRDGTRPVEEAFEAVIDVLIDPADPARSHRRLVRMGLILALASHPWIHKYTPGDTRADTLTEQVHDRLSRGATLSSPKGEELYPLVAARHQHLEEDREVHRCLSWMSDAPAPGLARRDLFHWWLCQAVPAAFMERLPDHIYSGDWPWPPATP